MKLAHIVAAMAFFSLLATPITLGSGTVQSEVEAEAIETQAGETTGHLVALSIDHFLERRALPNSPYFRLESSSATVVSHHTPAKVSTFDVGAQQVPIHAGPLLMDGAELRPGLQLLVTPLDAHSTSTVRVEHESCTIIEPPTDSSLVREPMVNKSRPPLVVRTDQSIRLASCTQVHALFEGSLRISIWEWDVDLNGQRVKTGIQDEVPGTGISTGTDTGPADELFIEAQNATLRIPLTPETYTLYLGRPELVAHDLRLTHAEGTLPGVLEPAQGEDVELSGDYTALIEPKGIQEPFVVVLAGSTQAATIDGQPLTLQHPRTPTDASPVVAAVAIAVALLLATWALVRFAWPATRSRKAKDTADTPLRDAGETSRTEQGNVGRDEGAERAVLRVVRRSPGVTVRRLQERVGISKTRCSAALDALLARGVVVRKGSEARWHLFLPSADLDETWEQDAAKQNPNLRLLLALLEEFPGVQADLVALCRERFGWHPSTTKRRLQRLAEVGLAEVCKSVPACKSVPRGTLLRTWHAAQPTEGK